MSSPAFSFRAGPSESISLDYLQLNGVLFFRIHLNVSPCISQGTVLRGAVSNFVPQLF